MGLFGKLIELEKTLNQIRSKGFSCYSSLDSTEGIVRTSAGVKHPKEETLTISVDEFRINFSPVNIENLNMVIDFISNKYLE